MNTYGNNNNNTQSHNQSYNQNQNQNFNNNNNNNNHQNQFLENNNNNYNYNNTRNTNNNMNVNSYGNNNNNNYNNNNSNIRQNNFQETKQSRNNNTRDSNRSANHSLMNDLYNKYEIEEFISPEQEEKNRLKKQKEAEAMERCMMLYERAKIKNEVNKINFFKNLEIKDNMELDGCTFTPQINERKNKQEENLKLVYKNTNIYNRSLQWKENKHNKIEKNRREIFRDNEEISRPPVNIFFNFFKLLGTPKF